MEAHRWALPVVVPERVEQVVPPVLMWEVPGVPVGVPEALVGRLEADYCYCWVM